MEPLAQLKALLDQFPNPDGQGTLAQIDKAKTEKAIAQLHQGGRELLLALIDLLVEPGQGNDVKPHFALHCLAVYVCQLEDRKHRREFGNVLASQLGADRPKGVKKYLIQELQVGAGRDVVPALGKALLDEDLCAPATAALVAIRDGAAEQLRAALPKVKSKCRLHVIQALAVLADAQSVEALKQALADEDREIRLAAAAGLANIGDPGSVDLLLKLAESEGWEGIRATDACFNLAERLLASGKKAEAVKIYQRLRSTRSDPSEQYVREAAERALAAAK